MSGIRVVFLVKEDIFSCTKFKKGVNTKSGYCNTLHCMAWLMRRRCMKGIGAGDWERIRTVVSLEGKDMTFDLSTFMKQRAERSAFAGSTPMKKWISLPRNGRQSLDFMGELIATITERNVVHSGASEWRLSIFRALPNHYVFASALRLAAPERMTLYSARVFETQQELRAFLLEGQHGLVDLPRLLLEKAGMLGSRQGQGRNIRPYRLQWGDGWASTWQLLAHDGFAGGCGPRLSQ